MKKSAATIRVPAGAGRNIKNAVALMNNSGIEARDSLLGTKDLLLVAYSSSERLVPGRGR